MDDTDLSGLDLAGAKAYLLEFSTAAKMARKELEAAEADVALWRKRVELAESKGLSDLATAANAKLGEVEARRISAVAEIEDLESKVGRIRDMLPTVAAKERSVDVDRLLAELQLMTGQLLGPAGEGAPGLESAMTKLESEAAAGEASVSADAGLAALKEKMGRSGH